MYTKEINLLSEKPKEEYISDKRNLKTDFILIAVFVLLISGVYCYALVLTAQEENFNQKLAEKTQTINGMKEKEYLYRTAKLKIAAAQEIISKREDLVPILSFIEKTTRLIQETTPDGILLQSIAVPDLTTINITGKAKDSSILDTFMTLLTERDLKFNFKQIKLLSLNRNEEKEYTYNLSLILAEPLRDKSD